MQDNNLIRTLQKDPDAGMELLMERYAGLVLSVIRGKLLIPPFTAEDVEDCAADTFLEFYSGLSRYDPEKGSVKAWLCVIARNKAVDRLRERYAAPVTASLEESEQYPDGYSLEGDLLRREDKTRLLEAVRALGEPDREIILRKYWLSQSSKEIALRLDMTVSNVDTRTHRAVEKLRKRLEENL